MAERENKRESRQVEAARLEADIAEVCGVINAATGRLVDLIASVLATESWAGWGIRSAEHWVAWKCAVSRGRARSLVAMARRLGDLPETRAALVAGELSEDQVKVVCRHTPVANDSAVAAFAKEATVSQLGRTLNRYVFSDDEPAQVEEPRRVSFGPTEAGSWRLSALLPPDEGAAVEAALGAARDELFGGAGGAPRAPEVSWADALLAMANRSMSPGAAIANHRDRHLVLVHVEADPTHLRSAHLHLGPALADGLGRYLGCDAKVREVVSSAGTPISVGRSYRSVPERTRIAIEERDGGCRVPGCTATRWLHCHHVQHWRDGGATDTANLLALCARHHRLHHQGKLGIDGDADAPGGVTFTDEAGRILDPCGRPLSPTRPPPPGNWTHPSGERLDSRCVHFSERAAG